MEPDIASQAKIAVDLEREVAARAAALAREETTRAVQLAEQRGRESAMITARLDATDRHFGDINGSVDRLAVAQEKLAHALARLAESTFTRKQVYGGLTLASMIVAAAFTATGHL